MNIVVGFLLIAVVCGVAVAGMLAMRRRAPDGGFVADGDRAAGVFGVIATGFSVLLGFLIFLAFESYDASRTGAETEAADRRPAGGDRAAAPAAVQRGPHRRARLLRPLGRERRVGPDGGRHARRAAQPVGRRPCSRTLDGVSLETPVEEASYDQWLEQTSTRQLARQDRIHGAAGVMPDPAVDRPVLHLADRAGLHPHLRRQRRAGGRAGALHGRHARHDHGHAPAAQLPRRSRPPGVGGLQPAAMERSLVLMDESLDGGRHRRHASRATTTGGRSRDARRRRRRASRTTGPRSSPPCCSRSRRSRRRGAATRPPAGTASRPRRRAASTRSASRPLEPRAWRRRRPRSTWPRSSSGSTPARTTTTELKDFYEERFRDEFKPAFEAWLATDPLDTAGRAAHPVRHARVPARGRARRPRRSTREAEALAAKVRRNIQRSTNYVLGVVLFAVALFFAGMSTKLAGRGLAHGACSRSARSCSSGTAAWIATFPVSLAIHGLSAPYFGAKRWPASRRMHEPLSIGFSTMAHDELAVLLGPAHALREGGVLGEHVGELVGDALGEAGVEQARRDRQRRGCRGCRGRAPSSASCRRCRPWPRCRRPGRSGPRTRRSTRC